MIHLELKT